MPCSTFGTLVHASPHQASIHLLQLFIQPSLARFPQRGLPHCQRSSIRWLSLAASASSSRSSSRPAKAKRTTMADLRESIKLLEAENEALRTALARYQGCAPSDVRLDVDENNGSSTTIIEERKEEREIPKEDETMGGKATVEESMEEKQYKRLTMEEFLQRLESGIRWPSQEGIAFWEESPRSEELRLDSTEVRHLAELGDVVDAQQGLYEDQLYTNSSGKPLSIVHVTAEMAPIAKVGGLGDVVTGLSKASLRRGYSVEVILPFYECLEGKVEDLQLHWEFECPKGRSQDGVFHLESLKTQAFTGRIDGCPVVLLRPDWNATGSNLFRGSRIYGGSYNETEAYLYFSRAALELLALSGRSPDVIHAHEWQCSAVTMLFWEAYANMPNLSSARPILTIHNMDNQGECRQDEFAATGLPGESFATVEKALDERTVGHNPERLCLLKGGIVYSSAVTTVSPTYAKETLSGGASGWLRSTLARPDVINKYFGVLNGIDTEAWNPAVDPLLPACFNASLPQGKAMCRSYLRRGLRLDDATDKPLVAVISRLVPQKGIHLMEHAVHKVVERGGQFVLLGTGHADGGLRRLAYDVFGTEHPDVRMIFGYSETLAHQIYGAADMILVPSMFEPCGLTQLIALRYGAVPVVRSTGGLADTVIDVEMQEFDGGDSEDETYGGHQGPSGAPEPNGFVFDGVDAGSLDHALNRALDMYFQQRDRWDTLALKNMRNGERWSWKTPSESYLSLYAGILS